jgi:hypothetical protein
MRLPPAERYEAPVGDVVIVRDDVPSLRILGDGQRGYLLQRGSEEMQWPEYQEFWFATLDEAMSAAVRLGVSRDAWRVKE